ATRRAIDLDGVAGRGQSRRRLTSNGRGCFGAPHGIYVTGSTPAEARSTVARDAVVVGGAQPEHSRNARGRCPGPLAPVGHEGVGKSGHVVEALRFLQLQALLDGNGQVRRYFRRQFSY